MSVSCALWDARSGHQACMVPSKGVRGGFHRILMTGGWTAGHGEDGVQVRKLYQNLVNYFILLTYPFAINVLKIDSNFYFFTKFLGWAGAICRCVAVRRYHRKAVELEKNNFYKIVFFVRFRDIISRISWEIYISISFFRLRMWFFLKRIGMLPPPPWQARSEHRMVCNEQGVVVLAGGMRSMLGWSKLNQKLTQIFNLVSID